MALVDAGAMDARIRTTIKSNTEYFIMSEKNDRVFDVNIMSACDVDRKSLIEFYDKAYPGRRYGNIWYWINRPSFYNNRTPIVMLRDGRIIAHAGAAPLYVHIDGTRYTASWFIDFIVLPEFQKKGFGAFIASKWMEIPDIAVEIGHNEGSGAVFKKLGWTEVTDTYLAHYFLRPFDHYKVVDMVPVFLRNALNALSRPFLKAIYGRYASPLGALEMKDMASGIPGELIDSSSASPAAVMPVRDHDYTKWRLGESPDKDMYRFFCVRGCGIRCAIKLCKDSDRKHIELLWISDPSRYPQIRNTISSLAVWGMQNGYSYIRHYTSDKKLSDYLRRSLKSLVNNPGFMYYAKNKELSERLRNCSWHWQLIDNDFEVFKI